MTEHLWGEFEIINRFFRNIGPQNPEGVTTGIGDDAAVLTPPLGHPLLATHDMMVEGVHYHSAWMPPNKLARKLVAVNVSDIAAMGGTPLYGLLSLALPDPVPTGWIEAFAQGLDNALKEYGISLIGGDTSGSPGPVMAALTLLGESGNGTPVLRHTPHDGDTLYVSGTVGDAALGLLLLEKNSETEPQGEDERYLIRRHIDPSPRLQLGREIASKRLATAMIDVSDGVLSDAGHLFEGNTFGVEIEMESLPLSEPFKRIARRFHPEPEILALTGGEDYELLFTSPVPPGKLSVATPVKVTAIGRVTDTPGVRVMRQGKAISVDTKGFQHLFHQKG